MKVTLWEIELIRKRKIKDYRFSENRANVFWERTLHCSFEDELLIYRFLCDDLLKQDLKKYHKEMPCYYFKKDWEEHIIGIIKRIPLDYIDDFICFLVLKDRYEKSMKNYDNVFVLPFAAGLIGGLLVMLIDIIIKIATNNTCDFYYPLLIITIIVLLLFLIKELRMVEKRNLASRYFYDDFKKIVEKYKHESSYLNNT